MTELLWIVIDSNIYRSGTTAFATTTHRMAQTSSSLTLGYQVIDRGFGCQGDVDLLSNISRTTTVDKLRDVIKSRRRGLLAHISLGDLVLWKILKPLPTNDNGDIDAPAISELLQRFRNNQGPVAKKLNRRALVSEYFDKTLLRAKCCCRASIASFYGRNPPQPVIQTIQDGFHTSPAVGAYCHGGFD